MSKPTTSTATTEPLIVRWSEILVPENGNIRWRDPADVERLAKMLVEQGQMVPVLVERNPAGAKDKHPYRLVEGYGRMAAFALNGWQKREILANLRVYPKGDHLSRIADNWTANVERKEFGPIDQARCLASLVDGTYDVPEGETASPVDRDEICRRFSISKTHLAKLVKLARTLDPTVADKARRVEAPLRLLLPLSNIVGEGPDAEAERASRTEKQTEILDAWIEEQKKLAESGRQRAERSDKGTKRGRSGGEGTGGKGGDGEERAPLSPTKKVGPEGSLRRPVEDYLAAVRAKLETKLPAGERRYFEGMEAVLRFLTKDLSKLPGLVAADFKALDAAEAEADEDSEDDA